MFIGGYTVGQHSNIGSETVGGPQSTPGRTFVYNCHLFKIQEKKWICVLLTKDQS